MIAEEVVPAPETVELEVAETVEQIEPSEPPVEGQETPEARIDIEQVLEKHETTFIDQQKLKKEQIRLFLTDKKNVPQSYYTYSPREALLNQYCENFLRQYTQLYSGRKELLFLPENEFGVKKFVSSHIRPTQLPLKELYDYRSCATFVSEFINYIPLDPPHELPKQVVSPTYTLKIQEGNCFDMSIVLVSLLRGVGYDAYVVSGYGSKSITTMNQTKTSSEAISKNLFSNFYSNVPESVVVQESVEIPQKYKVKPPRQLKSNFIIKQEEKKLQMLKKQEIKPVQSVEEAVELDDDDELKGLRVHAWVLVLPGRRDVAEAFFIEPSTGKIHSTIDDNYLGLESVFSSMNYWVNMQVCYNGLKGISFDLADNTKWEFVLLDNTQTGASRKQEDGEQKTGNASDEEDNEESNSEVIDMPPSWVDRLVITKEQFESRCPTGSKVSIYKDAKWEVFAAYNRPDGMVSRVTLFETKDNPIGIIKEVYQNRKDHLSERIRTPSEEKVQEFFLPGRIHGLREHIMINGETKEMHFYVSARPDGLLKRVHLDNKVLYYFQDREDNLVYRSVTYNPNEPIEKNADDPKGNMIKMTEKFARNLNIAASKDIYKKTYFIKEDKIRVVYHLDKGRIVASNREFKKPVGDQKGQILDAIQIFEVDPYCKPPKKQHLFAQLVELIRSESLCLQSIKGADRELLEIVQLRKTEEADVGLSISVYDTLRNEMKVYTDTEGIEIHKGDEEESKTMDIDYLSPFLINYPNPNSLTKEEALAVKNACLKSLRERLLEKVNIVQTQLDEVTAEYQRRQLAYSRNADSMTVEETDNYVKYCNDALFKIHILEKRQAKHKEQSPEKYIELDAKLRADPRLVAAFQ